jgi:hypothetical protein
LAVSIDPKSAGIMQLIDSVLASIDLPGSAGHPLLTAGLLYASICFVVLGAWNLAR